MIQISILPNNDNAWDKTTVEREVTINTMQELAELVCTEHYSPLLYSAPYRKQANFRSVNLLVIDVDENISLVQGCALFRHYRHAICTTRNHQKDKDGKIEDRYRVLIPLSEEITSMEDYRALYQAMIEMFPGVDSQVKDAARFFFKSQDIIQVNETGMSFDSKSRPSDSRLRPSDSKLRPSSKLTTTPQRGRKEATNYSKGAMHSVTNGTQFSEGAIVTGPRGVLSQRTLEWLEYGSAEGAHYEELVAAVSDMRAQGYTYEEAYEKCEQVFNNILGRELEWKFVNNIRGIYKVSEGEIKTPHRARKKKPLKQATLRALQEGALEPKQYLATAKDMRAAGYSEEEAILKIESALEEHFPEVDTKAELIEKVRSVYRGAERIIDAGPPHMLVDARGNERPDPSSEENYIYLLNKLNIKPVFNELSQAVEFEGAADNMNNVLPRLCIEATRYKMLHGNEFLRNFIYVQALKTRIHPVQHLVEGVANDSNFNTSYDYINDLAQTIPSVYPERFYKDLRKFLIGAIAKMFSNKPEQNLVLLFKGAQGVGKSKWAEALLRDFPKSLYASGDSIDPKNKDHVLMLLTKFIINLNEIDELKNRQSAGALKAFFTKDIINERRAYDAVETKGIARASFIASTNASEFLTDTTGNRRFMIVELKQELIDFNHSVNMLHVWYQAFLAWKAGEAFWYNLEEIQELNEWNKKYISLDYGCDLIDEKLRQGHDFLTASQILDYLELDKSKYFKRLKEYAEMLKIRQAKIQGKRGYYVNAELLKYALEGPTPKEIKEAEEQMQNNH
jgi:predicted RNase H-like HicB family nuclease